MAERRMFSKTIIDSDQFLDMPLSTQALYFHLSMRADDDGFINSPKRIMRTIGASDDDMKLLIAKQFIIPFESGVVVIKHWKIHNYIQKDRYKETMYTDEKNCLMVEKGGVYTLDTECIQNGYISDTQVRLGKYSIGEDSIGEDSKGKVSIDNNVGCDPFEEEFETLWERYPRKDGKKDALRHYRSARRNGVPYQTISEGLYRYIEYIEMNNTQPQFIKTGSSWFCGHHWDDEYRAIQKGIDWDNV